MLGTMGIEENRIALSLRSNDGRGGCSTFDLCDSLARGLLLPTAEERDPAARAAAAEDLDVERPPPAEVVGWCLDAPPVLETEGLRGEGFVPGGRGLFLGGAISYVLLRSRKRRVIENGGDAMKTCSFAHEVRQSSISKDLHDVRDEIDVDRQPDLSCPSGVMIHITNPSSLETEP